LVIRIGDQLVGWNIPNNREAFTITNIEGSPDLDSITDAGFFTTISYSEGLKIWNFNGELIATVDPNPIRGVSDTIFTPDGHMLLSYVSDDKEPIEIWEIHP
jgi:WD40 repeat protein